MQLKFVVSNAVGWSTFAYAGVFTREDVLSDEPGEAIAGEGQRRIVLFSHFDARGEIRPHTRAYICALREAGFDVVFVTNSGRLGAGDAAWAKAHAGRVIIRRNRGYDFGGWRDALALIGGSPQNAEMLAIANDSVYGPLSSVSTFLDRIDFGAGDVWSVTDSWQHRFHLQSYFIVFGPDALRHPAFAAFWRGVRNVRPKSWLINRYEVGLTRTLIASGLRCKAAWPYTALVAQARADLSASLADRRETTGDGVGALGQTPASWEVENPFGEARRKNLRNIVEAAIRRIPLNPMADLWRVLLEQGCPFLKRELLRDNPSRVEDVAAWGEIVRAIGAQHQDIILRDLEWLLKGRSP